jgi:tetratricopeptide (TPR) repeat protein
MNQFTKTLFKKTLLLLFITLFILSAGGCKKEKNADLEISDEFLDETQVFSNNSDFVYDNSKKIVGPDGVKDTSQDTVSILFNQLKRDPENPLLLNNIAFELYKAGKFDQALDYYYKALKNDPKMGTCYNNIALVYFQREETDKAIEMFKKCIEVEPEFVQAYSSLGLIYHRKKRPDEAKKYLDSALELNSKQISKVQEVINKGNHSAAALTELKKELAALLSNKAIAHNNLGLINYEEKNYKAASMHFQQALKLDSGIAVALYNLGMIALSEKNYAEAISLFERYLKLNPKQTNAIDKLNQARSLLNQQNSKIITPELTLPQGN